jgi:transcriptional regulator with GAF, ATPase, and Fis domain
MSLSAQAKVLRALQENMITRVGAEKILKLMYELLLQPTKT